MDPVDYALAYDNKFRAALGQRLNKAIINNAVLRKCLKLNTS